MFWIVGFNSNTYYVAVLDDADNKVEWLSVDELNYILQNNASVDIDYKGGSITRKGKHIGITENGRTCLGLFPTKNGYYVFDFYKRLIVKANRNMFKKYDFVFGFGITDMRSDHYLIKTWLNMLERCYYPNYPSYLIYGARGIYVDESFQRLSKFVLWYESQPNFKFRDEAKLELDKDLLGKKYYSTDSCILLPEQLNSRLGILNRIKTSNLPRFCREKNGCVSAHVGNIYITDEMKNTSYASSFYENLVIDFMDSRGITEWKYKNSMEDVGRLWVTAKNISFSSNKEVCDQSLQKDWIIKDYYDRLIDKFDFKITDWGLYEEH